MHLIANLWTRHVHPGQLKHALRVTVSALVALTIAQLLALPLPLWAVLTAIIVTQVSVGRSVKAATDYLIGTLGGAVFGAAIAALVPHSSEAWLLVALALAIAPMSVIAAISPRFNVAPVTAAIVILLPSITHAEPLASAIDRVLEVAIGAFVGFLVSVLLLPANAHRAVMTAAGAALEQMADAVATLMGGLEQGLDLETVRRIQRALGDTLDKLNTVAAEAAHEQSMRLVSEPDTAPLVRTLIRLRHDLVIVGRVALVPMPAPFGERLHASLEQLQVAMVAFLRGCGAALAMRRRPPSSEAVQTALAAFTAEVGTLRSAGLTLGQPAEAVERFFALGFAFEQMRANFTELRARVDEWAEDRKSSAAPAPDYSPGAGTGTGEDLAK